jgi:hypothetical protein
LACVTAPASTVNNGKQRPKQRPQAHGGALNGGGTPGNKGGGRKSKDFLTRCVEATEDDGLWHEARKKNPNSVLGLAASYAHGLPKQTTEHSGAVTIRVEFDE